MPDDIELDDVDAFILEQVHRAEQGDPLTDEEIKSSLARFEELLALSQESRGSRPISDVFASRMKAHYAVVELIHRYRMGRRGQQSEQRSVGQRS